MKNFRFYQLLHSLYALYPSTKMPDLFNQTDCKGMLSSFFLLNMKPLVILKQQRKKTDGFATIRMKQNTKQRLRH